MNVPAAGYNPYNLADFNNYNAQAYDNSGYANYSNFNNISPFSAWVKTHITGIGTAPDGMRPGDYGERMQTLSDRFSNYGAYSAAFTGASYLGSMAFMFPSVMHAAATGASAAMGGSPLGYGGPLNRLIGGVLSADPIGGLNALLNKPIDAFATHITNPFMKGVGEAAEGAFGQFGKGISGNLDNMLKGINPKGWLGGLKTGVEAAGGKMAWASQAMLWPAKLATGIASYMAVAGAVDTGLQGLLNATVGVDIEQDKISDTFESLSSRVLQGGSGHNAKTFAREMSKEIRARSFHDATPNGLMGYLNISDTGIGRFTGGWSAISEMQTKTAQYGLMAESGLLTKSGSADEFIKKADAMYAAISKLGDALGQTTTKAMETARALKSQGMSNPLDIANAGATIGTSSTMSGYSHDQVLAISGEATEAFRGSLFGSNMAFNMANEVVRKTALGNQILGANAYDKLSYENRGTDSLNVTGVRAMSYMYNSPEMRQMLIASMYQKTDTGFAFTGKVNASELANAASGNSFLTDKNALGLLNSNFQGMSQTEMRAAERSLQSFTSNMSNQDMQSMIGGIAKLHGYSGDLAGRRTMVESLMRQQGMSPDSALSMAKLLTADTRAQEFTYDYFQRKEQQLSKYISDRTDAESNTGLSNLTFGYSKLLGRNTALVETAGLMAMGGLMGGIPGAIIGAGVGLYSGSDRYKAIGERMGWSGDFAAPAAGGVMDVGANLAMGSGLILAGRAAGNIYAARASAQGLGVVSMGGRLMAGAMVTSAGIAGGYAGDWVTANYLSDYSNTTQMGASASMGAGISGIGAAGLAWLAPSLVTPVGAAIAAVAGAGYGLYSAYNRLYGGDETQIQGERENLRNQMQILQGGALMQEVDPELYARMVGSVDRSKLGIKFTEYDAATKSITDTEKLKLYGTAGKITRAFHGRGESGAAVSKLLQEHASGMAGYEQWKSAQTTPEVSYWSGRSDPGYLSMERFIGNTYAGKTLKIDSDQVKDLAQLRYMTSQMSPDARRDVIKRVTEAAAGAKIVDGSDNIIYKDLNAYFTAQDSTPFERSKEFLNDNLKAVNKEFNNLVQGNTSLNLVTASNATAVYGLLANYGKGGDAEAKAIRNARSMGMSEGEIITIKQMMGDGALDSEAIERINTGIANIHDVTQGGLIEDGIKRFARSKSAMLGDALSPVKAQLTRLLGRGDMSASDLEAYNKLKLGGFKTIEDGATRTFMQQSAGAMDVLDQVHGKTWGEYEQLVKSATVDSSTKEMLLKQMTGRDKGQALMARDAADIKRSFGEQFAAANLGAMSQSTVQSLAEQQATSLLSIDAKMDRLISAVRKEAGLPDKSDDKPIVAATTPGDADAVTTDASPGVAPSTIKPQQHYSRNR